MWSNSGDNLCSNSGSAIERIETSSLDNAVKEKLIEFVNCFSTLNFCRKSLESIAHFEESQQVKLPDWLSTILQNLSHIESIERVSAKFDSFDGWSPRSDRLDELWYTLYLRGYADAEEREFLQSIEDLSMFPIGEVWGTGESTLAVNLNEEIDQGVYEYNFEDLLDNAFDGSSTSASIRKIFDSYADMFSHIIAIKVEQENEIYEILNRT